MTRPTRSSRVPRAASAALLATALLGNAAHAQPGSDLNRHVNLHLRDAVATVGACVSRAPGGAPLAPTVELEATVSARGIAIRVVDASIPAAVRQCIEQAAAAAVVARAGERIPSAGTVRVRIPLMAPRPPAPPTPPVVIAPSAPIVIPSLAVGQAIEVEWNGQWYPAQVVAVNGAAGARVHFTGWSDAWDDTVPYARVRITTVTPVPPAYPTYPPQPAYPPQPPQPAYPPQPPQPAYPPQPPQPPTPTYPTYPPQPPQPTYPTYPPQPSYDGNLVVNGGFEQSVMADGAWQVVPQIPGWFVTSGPGFELQASAAGSPAEGRQLLELDSNAPTSVAQDVNVQPGVTYELRISFSARPNTPIEDNRVLVLWDGRPIGRLQADGRGNGDTRWTLFTAWVTATSTRARLELRDEGTPNSVGSYVDDVRLTPAR